MRRVRLIGAACVFLWAAVAHAQTVRTLPIRAAALVAEPVSGRLYAATPPVAETGPNSLIAIDPVAGTSGTPVFVGSDPRVLAPTSDGQFLCVGLAGASAVRRFDLAAGSVGLSIPLVTGGWFDTPEYAKMILPVPGAPRSIVVGQADRGFPMAAALVVYDDAVARPNVVRAWITSVVALDATTLLATGTSEVYRLRLDADGVSIASQRRVSSPAPFMTTAGGLVYAANGSVYDAASLELVQQARLSPYTYVGASTPEPTRGRWYRLFGGKLIEHDLATFDIRDSQAVPLEHGEPDSIAVLGGGVAYHTDLPRVVLLGDFAASPPPPPTPPVASVRVTLDGCVDCRPGMAFSASATLTNGAGVPLVAEVKARIVEPYGPAYLTGLGSLHRELTLPPGATRVELLSGVVPPRLSPGEWRIQLTLLDPVSGRTLATTTRTFNVQSF